MRGLRPEVLRGSGAQGLRLRGSRAQGLRGLEVPRSIQDQCLGLRIGPLRLSHFLAAFAASSRRLELLMPVWNNIVFLMMIIVKEFMPCIHPPLGENSNPMITLDQQNLCEAVG
mmetsp:Transcript_32969/g.51425  ORF Transcript_32969/g.51425 Transcript_32969/m.51425 type:complete len:114 (+) Transcript_32969:119-460(+)